MTDKKKRKENIITALLIAGMCVIVGVTVIFVVKFIHDDKIDNKELAGGVNGASEFSENGDFALLPTTETTESEASETSATPTPPATPTPTPEPTPTPTPTPTPAPEKLTSLKGYKAGDVIDSELIDRENLSQYFTSYEIEEGDSIYERINGQSYYSNDNIGLFDLRYLKLLHVNFDGEYQVGELIVNKSVAGEVLEIFEILCAEGYEIYSMYLIDDFWAGDGDSSDWYSIDANNSSAFCYRTATGSGNLSKHALGKAIDINPQQNPYVTYNSDGSPKYSHDNASDYVSGRSSDTAHVITHSDRAYELFTSYGWTWGGDWSSPKDYQHFQKS